MIDLFVTRADQWDLDRNTCALASHIALEEPARSMRRSG
jgi:hypothetical protein